MGQAETEGNYDMVGFWRQKGDPEDQSKRFTGRIDIDCEGDMEGVITDSVPEARDKG